MVTNAIHRTGTDRQQRTETTALRLYDAECALHAAHQTGVDEWIAAAADALHTALTEHLAAVTRTGRRPHAA